MSTRPGAEHGQPRGRERRAVGELGLVDPTALPALTLSSQENYAYSADFIRTSSPFQGMESVHDFRSIHGFPLVTGFDSFTIATWLKWPSTGTANVAACGIIGPNDAVSAAHWGLAWGPTVISGLNFWINALGTASSRTGSPNIAQDTWVHFMGTYNRFGGSPTLSGFLNGDNTGWTTAATFATAKTLEGEIPFGIGRNIIHSAAAGDYGKVRMMNVLYWNRKLGASELAAVYNGGNPHPAMTQALASGLRLWWKLGSSYQERQRMAIDGRQYGTVYDSSGNGFHGIARSHGADANILLPTYTADAP